LEPQVGTLGLALEKERRLQPWPVEKNFFLNTTKLIEINKDETNVYLVNRTAKLLGGSVTKFP
jgi:hypothetical protein